MGKKVIIVGSSGGFGTQMATTFLNKGWQVIGLCRHPEEAAQYAPQGLQLEHYDASSATQSYNTIVRLADPHDIIVYALNPPYHLWHQFALTFLDPVIQAATHKQLTLLFPGNVYLYDPATKTTFAENDRVAPPTDKGIIRQQMEERLQQACENGLNVILLRAGNFIDTNRISNKSFFNLLVKDDKKSITVLNPSKHHVIQCWAYLPDYAATFEKLTHLESTQIGFHSFHFKGHEFTFQTLYETLNRLSDKKIKLKPFAWMPLKIVALFSPLVREVLNMRYLWDTSLLLEDTKLTQALEKYEGVVHTPLDNVLKELRIL